MKRIFYKILIILLMLTTIASIINLTENVAATYSFSFTGPVQANIGDNLTYTITANGLTGNVKLSGNNVSLSVNQTWVEKNSVSVTAKITGFPASITATPVELTDNDYNIVSLDARTINITDKQTTVIPPTLPQTENNNSGQTGESSNGQSQGNAQGSNQGNAGVQSQGTTNNQGNSGNQGTSSNSQTNNKGSTGTQTNNSGKSQVSNNGNSENQEKIKSSNNYLKSLQINIGTLEPEFYRETFEYTVNNIVEDEIVVSAEAEDEKATINGLGTIALDPGENRINIEVIAENEQARIYTIIANKDEKIIDSDVRLATLEIQTINEENLFEDLDIDFDKEKLNYEVNVDEDVTDLNVVATVDRERVLVEVEGDKNLKEGDNEVKIILTEQDDISSNENVNEDTNENNIATEENNSEVKKTIYTIKVNKRAKPIVEVNSKGIKANQVIAGLILCFITIGVIACAVINHIRHK